MGGYGSGRPQTRPGASTSLAFPISYAAALLAELRRRRAEGEQLHRLVNTLSWTHRPSGRPAGGVLYAAGEDAPGEPWAELRYSRDGAPVVERFELAERPSNLGRGQVVYWRCAGCRRLARVLYAPGGFWRCRRCAPVVYDSSRESDARVSALLARAAAGVALDLGDDLAGRELASLSAGALLSSYRESAAGLLLALKALDRIGLGLGLSQRAPRWHGSMGRARPRR